MSYDKSLVNNNGNDDGIDVVVGAQRSIEIEQTGVTVSVPNNPWARLCYYLSCVNSCLDCIPIQLRDYKNYTSLTTDMKELVLKSVLVFNVQVMMELCFIPVPPEAIDSTNTFFEVKDTTRIAALGIDNNRKMAAVIEGQSVEVHTLMAFTGNWVENNYLNPLKQIKEELENPTPRYSSPPPKSPATPRYSSPPSSPTPARYSSPAPARSRPISLDLDEPQSNKDLGPAMCIFIVGWCFAFIWIFGLCYLKSKNQAAKMVSICSVCMYYFVLFGVIGIVVWIYAFDSPYIPRIPGT